MNKTLLIRPLNLKLNSTVKNRLRRNKKSSKVSEIGCLCKLNVPRINKND